MKRPNPFIALLISLLVPISGCMDDGPPGPAKAAAAASAGSAGPEDAAPYLNFTRCAELNFLLPIPLEDVGAPPELKVKTVDPAGLVTNLLVTSMKCERLGVREATVEAPTAIFMMFAVEPVAGAIVSDAVAYFWLGFAASAHDELLTPFRGRGVEAESATISLTFQDVAGNAKMRGAMAARLEGGLEGRADTQMIGSPFSGVAGTLGLYTVGDEEPLRAHAVHFSNYRGYERGMALIDPGFLPLPVDAPGLVTATHNFDYDVGFELDVFVKPS